MKDRYSVNGLSFLCFLFLYSLATMTYKIAYLTSVDPKNRKLSSGVYFYQSNALNKHCGEVHYVGPVKSKRIEALRFLVKAVHKLFKIRYNASHSLIISRIFGKIISKKLKKGEYDYVFADKSSAEIAFLKTDIPIIYSTDATFRNVNDYYPRYSNLIKRSVLEGNIIEQNAIDRSALILSTSQWAANSMIYDYSCTPHKVHVLPRGANIEDAPDIGLILNKRKNRVIKLLFIGLNWERKGFDIAYKAMAYMRSKGVAVKLIAAGISPPEKYIDEDVELLPYIDKNSSAGRQRFSELMLGSDFFFLPTRAEALGIVFCEASAYGLPVITTDTGGVAEIVRDGINGYALPMYSHPKAYGKTIMNIISSDQQYETLVKSSRRFYDEKLNWDAWGKAVKALLDQRKQSLNGNPTLADKMSQEKTTTEKNLNKAVNYAYADKATK